MIVVLIGLVGGLFFVVFYKGILFGFVSEVSWFYMLKLFYFGILIFEWLVIIMMILIVFVSMVELMGVYFVLFDIIECKLM